MKYTKHQITWTLTPLGEECQITITDDGEGIPQEYIERIFDPFFQVPGKEKAGSTGLGLDSVRELINLHGGKTWAESPGPGLGSQFHILIPMQQTRAQDGN